MLSLPARPAGLFRARPFGVLMEGEDARRQRYLLTASLRGWGVLTLGLRRRWQALGSSFVPGAAPCDRAYKRRVRKLAASALGAPLDATA